MIEDIIMVWFITMGVFALTKEQMPFEFWQQIINDKKLNLRSILFEPLTECLCCMASFWTCVWFGWTYEIHFSIWIIILCLFGFVLVMSILFGRAKDVDFLSRMLYFGLVIGFVFMLPTNNIEAAICMVAVMGINYHIEKNLDKGL